MANPVSNGFIELKDGMNGTRNPALLSDTQCAKAINVSFRGGLASTRPAFVPVGSALPEGTFRGAARWSLENYERIVFVISNSVYIMDLSTAVYTQVATLGHRTSQCFFLQADRYFVVQDASTDPVVLEDTNGTVAVTTNTVSIPRGYMGIFAHGRIHMVPVFVPLTTDSGKPYIVSGDILEPANPETVLKFSETEYLAEGGAHTLPAEMGFIGGLGVIRNAQTGTGLGSVIALARNGLCSFDFSISRSLWKEQAISNVLFFGAGCKSPWAVINMNDDLLYRSSDGLRTLKYSASQLSGSSGSLSNTPMSQEVKEFFVDDAAYIKWVSLAVCDNRLFCTAAATADCTFNGLVVWDVGAAFYSGAASSVGAYDGLWTGSAFNQVISATVDGVPKMYVFAGTPAQLYKLDDDTVLDPSSTKIESRIETKAYNFGDVVSNKKLQFVELSMSDISTDTTVKVWYRPHGYPLWKLLGTKSILVPAGSLPQTRQNMRFSVDYSTENCDPVSSQPLYVSTLMQFALQWTGRATVDNFRATAEPSQDGPPDPCSETESVVLSLGTATGEMLDDFSYKFGGTT